MVKSNGDARTKVPHAMKMFHGCGAAIAPPHFNDTNSQQELRGVSIRR
jgi:hypothetical protein